MKDFDVENTMNETENTVHEAQEDTVHAVNAAENTFREAEQTVENTADDVEEILRKADKQRASYYNYYATGTWGDVSNYDLCVDTGTLGIEGCVDLICHCVEIKKKQAEEEEKEW